MAPQPKMGYKTYFVILYFTYDESCYIKNSLRLFYIYRIQHPYQVFFFSKVPLKINQRVFPIYRVHNEQTLFLLLIFLER